MEYIGDVLYDYASGLYVNLTNRCPCRCEFCIRTMVDSLGDADTLWLKREPSAEEVKEMLKEWNLGPDLSSKYDEIVDFAEIGRFIEMPLRNYSSGMKTRLAFSIASIVKPEILIVDEILSVGDAAFQEKSLNRMKELMSGGATVLFVSHEIEKIEEMCTKAVWLDHGKIVMIGDAVEVCEAYKKEQEKKHS